MVSDTSSATILDPDELEPSFYNNPIDLEIIDGEGDSTDCPEVSETPRKDASHRKDTKIKKAVDSYYTSLSKFPPLSRQEEVLLFAKYKSRKAKLAKLKTPSHDLQAEVKKIKDKIINHNLRFVVKVAAGFWIDGNIENFENMISAGNLGLVIAVDKFKPNMGNRFLTYAAYWIALEIRTEISKNTLIRIPTWWQRTVRDITKTYLELSKGDSRNKVGVDAMLQHTKGKVKGKHIKALNTGSNTVNEYNLPKGNEFYEYLDQGASADSRNDCEVSKEEKSCISNNTAYLLRKTIKKLGHTEQLVINQIFGIDEESPKNLRQIANILGNTSERVRQIKVQGILTLRKKILAPQSRGGLDISSMDDLI